jgi:hypothetical protein
MHEQAFTITIKPAEASQLDVLEHRSSLQSRALHRPGD